LSLPPTDLVLVHGWGMNNGVWQGLPDRLRNGCRLHPIGLPGHGEARFDADRISLPDWADACLERAPEHAVWLGWSLGGLVALQAARQAPKRIVALVLMTATPRFVQAADWRPAMPAQTLARFHEALIDEPATTLERFLALQVRGSEDARGTLRRLRAALARCPEPDPSALRVGLDLLAEEDLRGPLPDIAAPALWLFGGRDTLVPAGVGARVTLLMPGARSSVIDGAAHAPLLSHADETANRIIAFLNEIAR
jgi:pimeloyl-[acyl-carrier protein] methyl ester esterase